MARRWLAFGVLMALAGATPVEAAVKRPDLAPTTARTASRQAAPGDTLKLSWTLKNRGRRAVRATATRLFLSTNAKLDRRDIRLGAAKERALRPGKSTERSLRVVIPPKTAPASYRLLVCADAAGTVRESNERNNCRATAALRVVARRSAPPAPVPAPGTDAAPAVIPAPSPVLSVAIAAPGADAALRAGASVTLRVKSTRGLRALEVRLRGDRVGGTTESDVTGELTRTIDVDVAAALNGGAVLEATATDAAGVRADAEPIPVVVDNDLPPETGPSTALILEEPLGLTALAPKLAASGLRVAEYYSERRLPSGETLTGGFYGRGLTLEDQLATYLMTYERKAPDQEPEVFGLRVEGDVDPADLGELGDLVEDAERVEPGKSYSAARARLDGRSVRAVTHDDEPAPWWPSFGQLDTEEYTEWSNPCTPRWTPLCLLISGPWQVAPWNVKPVDRVTFTHTLVWQAGSIFDFLSDRAYEHDFKIESAVPRAGTRPFCSGAGEFYASRKGGVLWETTIPADAAPYLDADEEDSCSTADLTIGVAFPEYAGGHHLDPVPSDHGWWGTTGHRFTIDVQRDRASGKFLFRAQALDRTGCNLVPRWLIQLCVGLDVRKTRNATIVSPDSNIQLPVCLAWRWFGAAGPEAPQQVSRCAGDRDRDGWDDRIDCGPDTPSVHPGALEVIADGVDQDCDGFDYIIERR